MAAARRFQSGRRSAWRQRRTAGSPKTSRHSTKKRVDFRNLVRDLASMFRTRIELKQIGVRDEAKRLDGIGRCGRQYCSASWLPELRPVNLGVAKEQRLSLNPSQISGACGRLMCCLRYEHEFYVQSRKRFPKEGKVVATSLGEEKVMSIDIFRERVTLRGIEGEARSLTLAEFRQETERAPGEAAAGVAVIEEEHHTEPINPDEISPELMYTSEHPILTIPMPSHPVPALRTPAPPDTPERGATSTGEAEAASKRRRGRRGGRRGRGGEDGSAGSS